MTAFDVLEAYGQIDDRIILEVTETMKKQTHSISRIYKHIVLFAAAFALMLCLGIAAYATNLFGIKDAILGITTLGDNYTQNEHGETVYSGQKIVPATVVSLVGYIDTPEYWAAKEFTEFYNDYVANDYYGDELHQPLSEWGQAHRNVYNELYTPALENKFLEICEKYDLQVRDAKYIYLGSDACAELCRIAGIDSFLDPEGRDSSNTSSFTLFNDGSFYYNDIWTPDESDEEYFSHAIYDITVSRNIKGYAATDAVSFDNDETITEWEYVTAHGDTVDLIMGENSYLILYDGADAFISVRWGQIQVLQQLGFDLSASTLERYADGIDFRVLGAAGTVSLPDCETNVPIPTPQP